MRNFAAKGLISTAAGVALLAVSLAAPPFAAPASAQEVIRRRPWSLFDMFRPAPIRRIDRDERGDRPRSKRPTKRSVARPKATGVAPTDATTEAAPVVEKTLDARTILIIGDFMASGLAEGLTNAFAQDAAFRIVDRTKGSSGIVRTDVYNWPKELPGLIAAEKPAAIVIMIGSNDRQSLRVEGEALPVGSDAWNKEYDRRVTEIAEALETTQIPYLWTGVPAFKSAKLTSDIVAFNDAYKVTAEANKGEFVDIWDGFVDEAGAFITTGPDVNGQPAKLRGSDGVTFTKAGKAKVAFYVDKSLRKLLGIAKPDPLAQPVVARSFQGPIAPGPVTRTEPMALGSPALDGATELLGANPATAGDSARPAAPAAPPLGRADNFNATQP